MRRRLLLLASFAGTLVACASILGDFDVDPNAGTPDGSTLTDGSSSGNTSEGGLTDAGDGGPTVDTQPAGVQVAASTSATCATVQYPGKQVTYCWGAVGAKYPAATVGTNQGDPSIEGFSRPRLPVADVRYLTFSFLTGAGTGEWFVGRGGDGQTTATYAWGSNDNGESAAGASTPVMPTVMKLGTNLLQFDTIYAAPNHGCAVQNTNLFCWGLNTNCELRSGLQATCNTELPALTTTGNAARTIEDESSHTSGKGGQIIRVAGGLDHTCRHVKTGSGPDVNAEDEVQCWGSNVLGQIDVNGGVFIDSPSKVLTLKRGGAELAAGENHTCAITDTSKIACWGKNDSGQSNPANPGAKAKVTDVAIPGNLSTLRAAGDLSCVVAKVIGQPSRVWCWGNGPKGRAAGEENQAVGKVAGIQDVTQLAVGRSHACAVGKREGAGEKDTAHVWCWGSNDFKRVDPRSAPGQLILRPIQIQFPAEPAN